MRQIKFRAWDGQRMHHEGGVQFDQFPDMPILRPQDNTRFFPFDGIESGEMIFGDAIAKPVLMQFTGLKDKNDQDIYEGDIVGWFRPSDGVEVEFRNGSFGIEYFKEWIILGINAQHFAEVLGNIHEHPELLEP